MNGGLRGLVLRALYFLPALALRALGWRLLRITNVHRIGHLAAEPDALVKEVKLGRFPARRTLFLAPRGGVANEHLVTYWERYFRTVRSPALCTLLAPLNRFAFVRLRHDLTRYLVAINGSAAYMPLQAQWGQRPPVLELSPQDVDRGEQRLRDLGIPAGARFVCIHSREGGYSPGDEHLHSFRNTSIENYLPAAQALWQRGVYSVRMGDPSMQPLAPAAGVVDYACSALRADWMDVFLCARCEFFLGNSSGITFLATTFGRPAATANLIPFSGAYPYGPADLGIPKVLARDGQPVSFAEILGSEVAHFRDAALYARAGVQPVENSADEVRDLALEMLDRREGRASYLADDERRQARFRALFRPGHFSYGSAGRVGRDFLRKYEHLFGDRPHA